MERLTVYVTTQEREALQRVSLKEMRDFRAQARLIIRKELEKLGEITELLSDTPFTLSAAEVQAFKHPASAVQGEDHVIKASLVEHPHESGM